MKIMIHRDRLPVPVTSVPVAIVGAGPVGLSLAVALSRHRIPSTVLEQKPTTSEHSKAPAIHIRTREAFRQWDIADRFVAAGTLRGDLTLHRPTGDRVLLTVDFSELDDEADRPGVLVLEQGETERLLLHAALESGYCDVRFGTTVTGVRTGADGVTVTARGIDREHRISAEFAVGCDGAGSLVREQLGQPFAGNTYELRPMLADVAVNDDRDRLPWPRTYNRPGGVTTTLRIRPNLWRVIWLSHVAWSLDPSRPALRRHRTRIGRRAFAKRQ